MPRLPLQPPLPTLTSRCTACFADLCHLVFWERQAGIDSLEVVSTAEGGRGLQLLARISERASTTTNPGW